MGWERQKIQAYKHSTRGLFVSWKPNHKKIAKCLSIRDLQHKYSISITFVALNVDNWFHAWPFHFQMSIWIPEDAWRLLCVISVAKIGKNSSFAFSCGHETTYCHASEELHVQARIGPVALWGHSNCCSSFWFIAGCRMCTKLSMGEIPVQIRFFCHIRSAWSLSGFRNKGSKINEPTARNLKRNGQ